MVGRYTLTMKNIVTIGRACVLWAVLLWAVPVFGQGPLASTQKDAAKALEEKKPMRLKDGTSEHERAAWEKWLEMKPKMVAAEREKVKQAERMLRLSRSASVGEDAVNRLQPQRHPMIVEAERARGVRANNKYAFTETAAAFRTKELKEAHIEQFKNEAAEKKARLKGLQDGYVFEAPTLWGFADRETGAIAKGMVGDVLQVRVTSILSDTEFVGFAQSLERGAQLRQCVFTNYDTDGLVDNVLIEGPFFVKCVGTRDMNVVIDGQIASKRLFELRASSFYDMLEPVPEKPKAEKAGKGKQADQKAKDAGSEQPQPDESEEPAGEPDKR